jgi:hypothetical protein
MANQQSAGVPYNKVSGPASVFFTNDYQLVQFLNASAAYTKAGLQPFVPLIVDLTLCRAVDSFLTYISDLLTLIYKTTPGGRKPRELSRRGIDGMDTYVKAQLNFALFRSSADLARIVRVVETRNLFTHNRGVLSARFLERVPGFAGKAGEHIQLPVLDVAEDLVFLQEAVQDIDFRATRTFKLPKPFPLFGRIPPKPVR